MTTVNNLSVWPETLPPPRVEGYSLSPQPSLLRTEMETGAARHRLRSLTAHYQVQAEWRFSEFQFAVFDAWWALNTRLGEPYEVAGEQPEWETLRTRCEPYRPLRPPPGVVFITFGIDVQENRIVIVIRGWGAGEALS